MTLYLLIDHDIATFNMLFTAVYSFVYPARFLSRCVPSGRRWIGEADMHDFEGMLTRDLIQQVYGIPNFDLRN